MATAFVSRDVSTTATKWTRRAKGGTGPGVRSTCARSCTTRTPSCSASSRETVVWAKRTSRRGRAGGKTRAVADNESGLEESAAADAFQTKQRPKYVPNSIDDPNYVRIFDTTLRDGEQSPGATLTIDEKVQIASQLSKLGVDIIEAGFPRVSYYEDKFRRVQPAARTHSAFFSFFFPHPQQMNSFVARQASPDDFKAVQLIAQTVGTTAQPDGHVPVICGLSRTIKEDLDSAWNAVKDAKLPRVHTFIATSEIHMKHKLRMTEDEVVENAVNAVKYLKGLGCNDIEFSPEDAGRSNPEFLYRILGEVIKVGATTLNIPDTTGWNLPLEFGELIAKLKKNVEGIDDVIISTHCQNDLGLSTANSLSGAQNGARQLECTINGIGERAGNASLEEIAMAIMLRGDQELGGLRTGIVPKHIHMASKMVSEYSGMVIQPHKAIVGMNAFAHESGIHQDGMLKSKETYEIMSPETIGLNRNVEAGIVLGKHSGRHAVKTRLSEMGYVIENEDLDEVFKRFKAVADKKKGIQDEDLEALVSEHLFQTTYIWELLEAQVVCGTMEMPTATVKMRGPDGMEHIESVVGKGPVDACYKAVDRIVKSPVVLLDYSVNAVTEGIDALAVTRVSIESTDERLSYESASGLTRKRSFTAQASDTDIVVSSTRAYVNALCKMLTVLKNIQ